MAKPSPLLTRSIAVLFVTIWRTVPVGACDEGREGASCYIVVGWWSIHLLDVVLQI